MPAQCLCYAMRAFMEQNPFNIDMMNTILAESAQIPMPPDTLDDDASQAGKTTDVPETLAILPLRGVMVYPMSALPLRVSQPRSIRLIDDATLRKIPIGLIAAKTADKEEPGLEDIFDIGTVGSIVRHFKAPDGVVNMIVQGAERFRIVEIISDRTLHRGKGRASARIVGELAGDRSAAAQHQRGLRQDGRAAARHAG